MPKFLPDNPRSFSGSLLFVLFILLMLGFWSRLVAQEVTGLTVEYSDRPLGIDVAEPRFGWQLRQPAGERGLEQVAYRLAVTAPDGDTVWNSGRVESGVALGVPYRGAALEPKTRYGWAVTAYGGGGEELRADSWFETGLLDASETAWGGAEWIGGGDEDLPLQSNYLSVFRVEYTLQLAAGSERASFVWGANDIRLLDRYKNLYGLENGRDESYFRLELDVSGPRPLVNVYRAGYSPDDVAGTPLLSLTVPDSVIGDDARYAPQRVELSSVFGNTKILVNGTELGADHESYFRGGWGRGGLVLNPLGSTDVIGFPMLADIGFQVPAGQRATFSEVVIRNFRAPANILWQEEDDASIFADTEGVEVRADGYHVDGGTDGFLAVADPSRKAVPMLRKTFTAEDKAVDHARLYVTARGVYEVFLNGERVGEDWFNPGLTQYDQTQLYQTYDVTDRIQAGENALGAWLGEGWWSGNYTFSGLNWNYFGDRQSLLALLEITYADGSVRTVTTDESWRLHTDGPLRYGSFFQGEVYDARREEEVDGWTGTGYDDGDWAAARIVPIEGTTYAGENDGRPVDYSDYALVGQIGDAARVVEELTARSVEEVRPGVYVYDMGTNMVGVPRIDLGEREAGQDVWVRYAEVLYPGLADYGDKVGMIMIENLRSALSHDHYVTRAGRNVIEPRFTFHGYRYLEITGIDEALPPEAVKGLVISSVQDVTADYVTSNGKVNQLYDNIVRSQYGNFLSIPTDCPQRNERMGWSGDISVFSRTATYFSDADQFFRRHLLGMRDAQHANGRFPDVAPAADAFGGMLWGSAGITIPWEMWQQYGDTAVLREHYPAMRAYLDFLAGNIDPESRVMSGSVLGDWLSPEGNQNDNTLLWEAYYIFDLRIMEAVARVLGHTGDAQAYLAQLENRRRHFAATYLDPGTYKTVRSGFVMDSWGAPPADRQGKTLNGEPNFVDTQVSYALPLALGAVSGATADSLAARLVEAVRREQEDDGGVARPPYSLMTGFIGTAWISKALSDYGYSETAYRLLENENYPSWLYPVTQGATSIWERLNSYTIEDGFGDNNSMNSFNHYSFGAVGQWMIAHSLGIQRGEPGFRSFVLRPEPDPTGAMTYARGHYDSPYGRIEAAWELGADGTTYQFTVPANTSARVELPAGSAAAVTEGDRPADEAEGVTFDRFTDGRAVYTLTSGTYHFRISD